MKFYEIENFLKRKIRIKLWTKHFYVQWDDRVKMWRNPAGTDATNDVMSCFDSDEWELHESEENTNAKACSASATFTVQCDCGGIHNINTKSSIFFMDVNGDTILQRHMCLYCQSILKVDFRYKVSIEEKGE